MAKKSKTFARRLLDEVKREIQEEDLAKEKAHLKMQLREIIVARETLDKMEAQLQIRLDRIDEKHG